MKPITMRKLSRPYVDKSVKKASRYCMIHLQVIFCCCRYRHKNIVSLAAYSFGEDCICLIFDFMKNGSLEYQLEGRVR